jgi:TRAP-type mannitol/chloroaromatic compound transport system substrate-binding protein
MRPFSTEILQKARAASEQVVNEFAAKDPFARRVYQSLNDFRAKAIPWSALTEELFYKEIQAPS